ncbi:MAG TPA: hypothetical protein VF268_14725 [Gammaproteobacteria bacterium]
MRSLVLFLAFLSGCAFQGNPYKNETRSTVDSLLRVAESKDGKSVAVTGYYWPSYEGSVLCQTDDFDHCVVVVLTEKAYQDNLNRFDKGDLVRVKGKFEWSDIEGLKKAMEESDEIFPYLPYHRIVNVRYIKRAR